MNDNKLKLADCFRWFFDSLLFFLSSLTAGLIFTFSIRASASEFCRELPQPLIILNSASSDRAAIIAFGQELVSSTEKELRWMNWKPINGFGPEEFWDHDGPRNEITKYDPKKAYESEFSSLLQQLGILQPNDYFENLLRQRKLRSEGTHVLDIFGSGFYIENQDHADAIIGMRLGAYKRTEIPASFKGRIPDEILGDVLNPRTWQLLDHYMQSHSIETLDIVTVRPKGGWAKASFSQTSELNALALRMIVGQVLIRFSLTGHFYFKVPIPYLRGNIAERPDLKELVRQVELRTPFRLFLNALLDIKTTYGLEAALIPK